jgi:initiation factor 1A
MVRNTKGGNKGKKIKRCRTAPSQKSMRYAESGEMYARVINTFGHGMAAVICDDGKERLLIIRKKFKGRNKRDNGVFLHSIVLVGMREWEVVAEKKKQKVDLLFVYSKDNVIQLKKKQDINRIIFGEKEEDSVVEFEKDYEEPEELNKILTPSENEVVRDESDNWLDDMIDDI